MKPIIVHSIGRSGSRSIYHALRNAGYSVRHCHNLTTPTRKADAAGLEYIQQNDFDVYTIVPIRDPLDWVKCAYWNNYDEPRTIDGMMQAYPPDTCDKWITDEIVGFWGVDVYAFDFCDWRIYENRLLVIRLDAFCMFGDAFKSLTGMDAPAIEKHGATHGDEYKRFIELNVPKDYEGIIKGTRYYKHFCGNI